RSQIKEYSEIESAVSAMAGRINGSFSDASWSPVRYVNRPYSRTALSGLYRGARVGLVTPLRDGMNLVAKEYVAAQDASGQSLRPRCGRCRNRARHGHAACRAQEPACRFVCSAIAERYLPMGRQVPRRAGGREEIRSQRKAKGARRRAAAPDNSLKRGRAHRQRHGEGNDSKSQPQF